MKGLETRMYFLTDYHISGIQKGIQSGHAAVEYLYKFGIQYLMNLGDRKNPVFIQLCEFCEKHKTFIVLNGGASTPNLVEKQKEFEDLGIPHMFFREPCLNNAMTAICYVADEQVWNTELYPDFEDWCSIKLSEWHLSQPQTRKDEWLELIGGEQNEFLKQFNRLKLG